MLKRLVGAQRRAGDPPGGDAGDAHPRPPVRHGPQHRGGAGARRRRRSARLPLFLRHAGRGGAHRCATPSATIDAYARRHRRDRHGRRRARARSRARASRSSSRRCIRATSSRSAERVMGELVPRLVELAQAAKAVDIGFTIDAEEADRLDLSLDVIEAVSGDPSLGGWDGLRPRGPGLPEARLPLIDWLADMARAHQPAADGAAGQGRLLGQRDQARARSAASPAIRCSRARRRPTSPTSPARGSCWPTRERLLPAVRHPQRPHASPRCSRWPAGAARDFEFQRLHGMGEALYDAGRRRRERWASPAASTRRSAATRICWPIWCGGCWRTAPTPPSSTASSTRRRRSRRSSPIRSRSVRKLPQQAASAHSAAARSLSARSAATPRGIDLTDPDVLAPLAPAIDAAAARALAAPRRSSAARARRQGASRVANPADRRQTVGPGGRGDAGRGRRRASRRAAARVAGLGRDAGRASAPPAWSAPPICWSGRAAG